MKDRNLPLSGIRVLDFTHVLAGPFCTYQLAVMGADVIKIESSKCIDMMRFHGSDDPLAKQNMSSQYQAQSANKRAMSLDLSHADSGIVLERLIHGADVLVVNYRKNAARKLNIDYERVKQINPGIVYCSLTGFGQTGPKADQPAYDNIIQAFSGLMAATGTQEQGPVRVGPPVLDYGTGAQAALAIVSSLFQRASTGNGNFIDVAMLDAAMMLMSATVTDTAISSEAPVRYGNRSARASYGCYATQKGELMIGAYTQKQITNLWRALGCAEKAESIERLNQHELDNTFDEDTRVLGELLSTRDADEWETLLNNADVPAARVRSLNESLLEPQVQGRSGLQTVSPASNNDPELTVAVAAWQSRTGSPKITTPPPSVGQHTREILLELGFTDEQAASFCQSGGMSCVD